MATSHRAKQRISKLKWVAVSDSAGGKYTSTQTWIAARDRYTWVLTRVPSGRARQFDLVLCDENNTPIIVGNELSEKHCKQTAQEQYENLVRYGELPKRTRSVRRMREHEQDLMATLSTLLTVEMVRSQLNRLGVLKLVSSWMLLYTQATTV